MAITDGTDGFAERRRTAALSGLAGSRSLPGAAMLSLPWPVLLYLSTVVIPIAFYAGPLYMTTLRLVVLVATVPLMIGLLSGRYGRVYATDILFALHIAWTGVAIAINNRDQVFQQVGSVGVEFLGGYLIGRAYIRTREDFGALCKVLVFIVLCTTPFAIYETLTGRPILVELLRKLPGLTSVQVVTIEARMGLERVQATFAHPIHYGLFCSVAFSLAFVALKGFTSETRRYWTSLVIAASGFLALSSGALTAIAMQMGFIVWFAMFAGFKQRWWLLVGLFALAYVTVDLLSNRSPIKVFMSYATFSAHNAYWRAIIFDWGMRSVWAHPLYGIGLNDWVRPSFMHSGSMDNFWLVMAVRYGIPGFIPLALGYILTVFHIMRRSFDGDIVLTQFRRAWVFTFLGLSFTLCTVHVWTSIYSFVFFMFGAGVWLITAQPGTTEDAAEAVGPSAATRTSPYSRHPVAQHRAPDRYSASTGSSTEDANSDQDPEQAAERAAERARSGPRFSRF